MRAIDDAFLARTGHEAKMTGSGVQQQRRAYLTLGSRAAVAASHRRHLCKCRVTPVCRSALHPATSGFSLTNDYRTRRSFVEGIPHESPFAFRPERFVGVTRGTYTWLLRAVVEHFALAPVGNQEKTAGRSITFSPSPGCEVRLARRVEDDDTRSRQGGRRARADHRVAGSQPPG